MVNYTYEYYQEGGRAMGQTDAQFKAFIRFILQDVQDAIAEEEADKIRELLKKMEDKLQKTLED